MAVYEKFYGFRAAPFSTNPDPQFLFLSPRHREALVGLMYAVCDAKGVAVLVGEVGTGKTTIVHALLTQLGKRVRSALLFNPSLSRQDLYLHLLAEFGLPPERSVLGSIRALQRFLLEHFEAGVRVVVVIDEAHAAAPDALEEIRLLSNFETSQSKLLQLLLVGQPELLERSAMRRLRQLRQRVALRFDLAPLQFQETIQYVRARLAVAGVRRDIFKPDAYVSLQRFSGGLPRGINILCDNALLSGYARDEQHIGRKLISRAAHDLGLSPFSRVSLWARLRARYHEPTDGHGLRGAAEIALRPLQVCK
ncbi:MAG: ExeA family protein [Candidatus Binatia bacterium]